jgi:lipid II:glycine glycyltransferase (peptidoglycan interpeptide bridge formation enzyme)
MNVVFDDVMSAASRPSGGVTAGIENMERHPHWDAFVERTPGGDVVQTSAWARVKARTGSRAERVVLRDSRHDVVAGAQLLVRRVRALGAVAWLPYGPVVRPDASDDAIDLLGASLREVVRRNRFRALFVQPPEYAERVTDRLRTIGFELSDADVAPSATLRLDMRYSAEELLARMARHVRRDMRRSMRQPLRVRAGTRDDLRSFAELHANSAARQGFTPMTLPYLQSLWDELTPGGHLACFMVDTAGVDLAGMIFTRFGDSVCTRLGGFAPERLPMRLRANESLHWAAVAWARSCGVRWCDLGGIGREPGLALVSGVSRDAPELADGPWGHKIVFGGVPLVYPEPLQLVPNPVLRVGYRALHTSDRTRHLLHNAQRALRVASASARGGDD